MSEIDLTPFLEQQLKHLTKETHNAIRELAEFLGEEPGSLGRSLGYKMPAPRLENPLKAQPTQTHLPTQEAGTPEFDIEFSDNLYRGVQSVMEASHLADSEKRRLIEELSTYDLVGSNTWSANKPPLFAHKCLAGEPTAAIGATTTPQIISQ